MEFEYDPAKSLTNLAKHGIDFEIAQRLWDDTRTVTFRAQNSGNDNVRFVTYGEMDGRHWTAVTTMRGKRIRIISVRRSRKNEEERYEQYKQTRS